ncbi:MAG: mechanosensitive ion channel family protein [Prevotella sp.]|jgi:miniconductance mechanosensitive channel
MEKVRLLVEQLMSYCGVSEKAVHVVALILLIALVLLLAWFADRLALRIFVPFARKLTQKTKNTWDDIIFNERAVRSACHLVPAIVVWVLLPMMFYDHLTAKSWIARFTAIYFTVAATQFLLALLTNVKELDMEKSTTIRQYILSFCGVLKIVFIFVAVVVVVAILINKSPMTLFAGLGATSAILMLVFKDTIEGLVAGIRLTSDEMVAVGDWITVPSAGADGTVLEISLTTVKIQNFDNTIVTVSPTTLVTGSFRNWKGMQQGDGRRVVRTIYFDFRSIHFTDEEQKKTNLGQYRTDMEKWLAQNPLVNTDMTFMVREKEATQSGLPVEFYFFLKNKNWTDWEHQSADIMDYAYAKAQEYGLVIYQQFPNQKNNPPL